MARPAAAAERHPSHPLPRPPPACRSAFAAALPERPPARVELATVDSFQGREADVVLLSCVRAQAGALHAGGGRLGFLADVRRMNVALTRARRSLLVLGHCATLAASPAWLALLQYASGAGRLLAAGRPPYGRLMSAGLSELRERAPAFPGWADERVRRAADAGGGGSSSGAGAGAGAGGSMSASQAAIAAQVTEELLAAAGEGPAAGAAGASRRPAEAEAEQPAAKRRKQRGGSSSDGAEGRASAQPRSTAPAAPAAPVTADPRRAPAAAPGPRAGPLQKALGSIGIALGGSAAASAAAASAAAPAKPTGSAAKQPPGSAAEGRGQQERLAC
jgi:hypothetical protein